MRLELSPLVASDLGAIGDYIAADNPERAVSFIEEIREQLWKIGQHALLYRLRPEIGPEARLATVGNYVVLFRVIGETVRIERVAHGSRNLAGLFGQESPEGNA